MVPCRHLPTITTTTRHLVQPATLRSGAWGDPTVGHLEMERLKLLLQDPQRPQSLQLPLATAGTHGVPKDEIGGSRGSCGKTMDLPTFPPASFFKKTNILPPSASQPLSVLKIINSVRDYLHLFLYRLTL